MGLGALFIIREFPWLERFVPLGMRAWTGLSRELLMIFSGSLLILVVGLVDDRRALRPATKLFGQVLAAALLLAAGLEINFFFEWGLLGKLGTLLWVVLMINAFNFIDSTDGHCVGISLFSALIFFWVVQLIEQTAVAFFIVILIGVLLGFLPHNFKPARMFLGDNGSMFLGYMMAAITLLCSYQAPEPSHRTILLPIVVFGVPLYDTISVTVVRLWRGVAVWEGDRNHFAHRLVQIGMSEQAAVIFSCFVTLTLGLTAILLTQTTLLGSVVILLLFVSIMAIIAGLEYYAYRRAIFLKRLPRRLREALDQVNLRQDRSVQ